MCGHSCTMTFLHLKVHNGQCKFSICLVTSSLYHCILGLVSTFNHGYAENIYAWTFMHGDLSALKNAEWLSFNMQEWLCLKYGHSCMMTFLHLKVHNNQCKYSIGSVSLSPCHYILGSVSTFNNGYAENIYAWTFMCDDLSALQSAEWLM